MTGADYERFFGLAERPFSLTPDPKYFFAGHSHGRTLDLVIQGVRRREPFLLVTADRGVGKTTLCHTLTSQLRRRSPVAYLSSPLLSAQEFERVLLDSLRIASLDDVRDAAVVVIDEAHTAPAGVIEVLRMLHHIVGTRGKAVPVVFAGQPGASGPIMAMGAIDRQVDTRLRLLPFGRDDCATYVSHRLAVAGSAGVPFARRAIDVLFTLSGGVPRLVNLLCEGALREAATARSPQIEPVFIEAAASALELQRVRPKRFRWFQAATASAGGVDSASISARSAD